MSACVIDARARHWLPRRRDARCDQTKPHGNECVGSRSAKRVSPIRPPEGLMADASDSLLSIRAAFYRKALADARQRAALARRLGFTESEVLAVQHLTLARELTPG